MVYIGSDHAGYQRKQEIEEHLKERGQDVVDLGVFAAEPPADYPDIAHEVAEKVRANKDSFGILICGSGNGMCMVANKSKGIRAAHGQQAETVKMSRKNNDANILCLGANTSEKDSSLKMVDLFLDTPFGGAEHHIRSLGKIEKAA